MKNGWKVLHSLNGKYSSATLPLDLGGLTYIPWVTTKRSPKWGSIGVFDSYQAAIEFLGNESAHVIFYCEYTEADDRWYGSPEYRVPNEDIPAGSCYAESVMIMTDVTP